MLSGAPSIRPSTGQLNIRIGKEGKKVKREYSYSFRLCGKAVEDPNVGIWRLQGSKREGVFHVDYYLEGRLVAKEMGWELGGDPLQVPCPFCARIT